MKSAFDRKKKIKHSRYTYVIRYMIITRSIRLEISSRLTGRRFRFLKKVERRRKTIDTYHFSECTTSARSSMARFNLSRRASSSHRAIRVNISRRRREFAVPRSLTRHDVPDRESTPSRSRRTQTDALYF